MSNREVGIPSFDLTGKTAIITGGTKGLGFGISAAFAAYGANIVITARTVNDVEAASREISEHYCNGGRCIGVPADAARQSDIDRVINGTIEAFGALDILVNNAGISGRTAKVLSEECDENNFNMVIDNNLTSVFLFSKSAAAQMAVQEQKGKSSTFHPSAR